VGPQNAADASARVADLDRQPRVGDDEGDGSGVALAHAADVGHRYHLAMNPVEVHHIGIRRI
jgi:hypothetical protein